jgi:hypothetical protein
MKWLGKEVVSVILFGVVAAIIIAVLLNTDCLKEVIG